MAESGSSLEFSGSLTSSTLPPPRTRIFKIIVIGDSGVGKTCLTYRFCAGKFPEKTEATIGVDFRERLVEIDDEKIKVCTADSSPCSETLFKYGTRCPSGASGSLVCCDVKNRSCVSVQGPPPWKDVVPELRHSCSHAKKQTVEEEQGAGNVWAHS